MKRLALIAAAVLAVLLFAPLTARAAAPATGVALLDQSQWVQGHGSFDMRLAVQAPDPTDRVEVVVYTHLITRSAFTQAANGNVSGRAFYDVTQPLASLTPDPAGGVDIRLPVDQAPPAGGGFGTVQAAETGVFPVQVRVVDQSGRPLGQTLTTFLVYAQGQATALGYTSLSVAVVVPFATDPVISRGRLAAPSASEGSRLSRLASLLYNDSSVPVSILASPVTVDSLATGPTVDRQTVAQLNGVSQGGSVEVLPSTYSPVSPGDLISAGLAGEVGPQLDVGSSTLQATFGTAPASSTWAVDGPLDASTLAVLEGKGARSLIVPDSDLTALSTEIVTTFVKSTTLGSGGSAATVIAADAGLSADFTRSAPPVLAAHDLLADLAVIWGETPGVEDRGIVVMPPQGWKASPQFVSTLLAGLRGNPLVSPVTASSLFSSIGEPLGTRYLSDPAPGPGPSVNALSTAAKQLETSRDDVRALVSLLSDAPGQVQGLDKQLLLAESETISSAQRSSILAAIAKVTGQLHGLVSLPPATSITLTSTKGQVPISILTVGNVHPKVQLVLNSSKLIFQALRPRGGTCSVPSPSREVCTLTLSARNTTLSVPVETRSSGVFPLEVSLYTPDGGRLLASDQDTVRSTAVSSVGVVLIVIALAGLLVWWGRDLRRGRRPEGMAPAPIVGGEDPEGTALEEFFERPPPSYGPSDMSPSGAGTGPSTTTDTYGRGRETRD